MILSLNTVKPSYAGHLWDTLFKKATIHQVTTMLAPSKNVLFPGQPPANHRYWWLFTRWCSGDSQYWWLAGGYDLEIGHF